MVDYAGIQEKIDRGRGKAANRLGQPYSIYRLGAASTGDWPDAWSTIDSNYLVYTRRLKSERDIEVGIQNATLFFDLIADLTPFILGDVFLETDPPYDPGVSYGPGATSVAGDPMQFNAFALAWHPPIAKSVGGRIDRRGQIYRPATRPQVNTPDLSPYWRETHDGDRPLILNNGTFQFGGPGGRGSFIPCGLTSAYRPSGQKPFEVSGTPPGMLRPAHWFAYIPPLPGYLPRTGDALITEDGARYVVVQPYYQTAGVVGSQLMLDRTTDEVG